MDYLYIALWLALCSAVEFIAQRRGQTTGNFFFLAVFATPILAYLVVVAIPVKAK